MKFFLESGPPGEAGSDPKNRHDRALGVGLLTPPECPTEGLPPSVWARDGTRSHAPRGNAVFDAPRRLLEPRPRPRGRTRYQIGECPFPHFLTCTVVGWLPVFTRPETVQIVLDSWQFLQDQDRLVLFGYVVLENHIHFIASAENLAKEVGDFKSYTARRIIDYLSERHVRTLLDGLEYHKVRHKTDRPFQLWQEGPSRR